ncbi:MAG: hypothetical protein A2Y10_11990 [Planctomycetes bacterium GWF2_41_51]|nr:MAG: hypothetical protein A2Y10_11990 [Planctomycetes bacterium GWF2_41_51]HBG28666.1 hypothetical protein [Phycisphaerales bacterium]
MKKNAKAFTLAEMLIVVLIISAFTFIAVPRMGMATIFRGKSEIAANQIASAIRLCRTLAIDNAAVNKQGYSLNMTGSGQYSGFQIVNLQTNQIVKSETIPTSVSCKGTGNFRFNPLGSRTDGNGILMVTGGGKNYKLSVISSTGMVRCEKN